MGGSLPLFDKGVSLVCWAYNEEASIQEFLDAAVKLLNSSVKDYEIVLVDDGSTDSMYDIIKKFQESNPRLKIVKNERNMNVGESIVRAVRNASKEFMFWQTIDWSYDISDLRVFLEYLKDYDIVQGVRRKPNEIKVQFLKPFIALLDLFGIKHLSKRADTVPKAIVSVINYVTIRILFGVPLSDFQNVTIYSTKWIQSFDIEARSAFTNPECIIRSYWMGASIKEVPINFIPRKKGIAKGSKPSAIMKAATDILHLWFKWVVLGRLGQVKRGKIERLGRRSKI